MKKICVKCGEDFDTDLKLQRICESCTKSRLKGYHKEWTKDNRGLLKKNSKNFYEKKVSDPRERLFLYIKARQPKIRGGTDLTIEDFIIPEVCPVFNRPFEPNSRYAMSVDRIDNSKSYIKGNIQIISRLANTMKNCATEEELIKFAKWILNNE